MNNLKQISESFQIQGEIKEIIPWGGGHINDTFRVKIDTGKGFILQKINTHVFTQPDELMKNIMMVTEHIQKKEKYEGLVADLIPSKGSTYWLNNDLGVWRMHPFIEGKSSLEVTESIEICKKVGRSYGAFLSSLNDFPSARLFTTIEGFHDIRFRLNQFTHALATGNKDRIDATNQESKEVLEKAEYFRNIYESALKTQPLRVTHNDTKLNNVLISEEEEIGTVIDLDTVMPGFAFFDVGDTLRSMAISAKEDDPNIATIELCDQKMNAFIDSYLSQSVKILSKTEIESFAYAGGYMAYIMAVRFLTDYLSGDIYYKTEYADHNLIRAKNQMKVCELFLKS